ncbi:FIST signal transduction protein [Terricaulis sp.]|uniref:FIST signal transduction protein n=1 Tax=Terricaulis sp. TaxID=2768686 RepID=UPI0037845E7C
MAWDRATGQFASTTRIDPSFVLYFGPNEVIADHKFQDALRALAPRGHLLGCTTGTFIADATLHDDQALAVAVQLDRTETRLVSADVTVPTSRDAGVKIAKALEAPDLVGVIVLSDSLNVEGVELVEGMRSVLGAAVPISGGLASDGADFRHTMVGADGPPREQQVAALGLYGASLKMGQGCAHGWDNFGPPRRITKADGPILFELDGKPALDLYEYYLGDYAAQLPSSALRFPLLVYDPRDPARTVIRTVLNVDREARALSFAASIQEGWTARLMRGAFDNLAEGAAAAAREARGRDGGSSPGLALLVSCVGRRIVMGEHTGDEIEAVAGELPGRFQRVGFYSHGEISAAPNDSFCGLHNQTMTIVTLEEAA